MKGMLTNANLGVKLINILESNTITNFRIAFPLQRNYLHLQWEKTASEHVTSPFLVLIK